MQLTRTRDQESPGGDETDESDVVLAVDDLRVQFRLDEGIVDAVNGLSFTLGRNRTLGVVGESGCGKSVAARAILQVVGGTGEITGGSIRYFESPSGEVDLATLGPDSARIRSIRGNEIAMVFQEPMAAFSPIYTVGRQIVEGLRVHSRMSKAQARARAVEVLGHVGIPQPRRAVDQYPFELSGGMRQRAMIAMALSCEPNILIADEPTTALDVTIQAQILALLKQIQAETGMSIIIISHNMGVIAEMADSVAVMYLGRVVEEGKVWDVFDEPSHPYTRALLRSIPLVGADVGERLQTISGDVPNQFALPSGCHFHPRCREFMPGLCDMERPGLRTVSGDHRGACFLIEGGAE